MREGRGPSQKRRWHREKLRRLFASWPWAPPSPACVSQPPTSVKPISESDAGLDQLCDLAQRIAEGDSADRRPRCPPAFAATALFWRMWARWTTIPSPLPRKRAGDGLRVHRLERRSQLAAGLPAADAELGRCWSWPPHRPNRRGCAAAPAKAPPHEEATRPLLFLALTARDRNPSSVDFTPGVPDSMKSWASKCERVESGLPTA